MDNDIREIASEVAVNIITELFKASAKGAQNAYLWVGEKNRTHDPLGIAARKYSNNIEARYNVMRIFGMSEPRPLRSIFVRVNTLKKTSVSLRKSINTLRELYFENQRSLVEIDDTKSGIDVANDFDKLVVLGKPGSGKTTFLKFLLLQCLDGKLRHNLVPIFVNLKDWSESEKTLESFITQEFELCGIKEPLQFVKQLLTKGKCLVLLDGYDEIAYTKVQFAVAEIKNITVKYKNNRFVLSCRNSYENLHTFEHFTEVEIADFDINQIDSFVSNWFGPQSEKSISFFEKITKKTNLPIKELSSNPLLLTLLCITFDEILDFPNNRAELYKESIDALLRKWDSSRSIKRHDPYNLLSLRRKESLFTNLAIKYFQNDQYFVAKRTLESDIANFIRHLPIVDEKHLDISSENVLKTIESHHGILVERSFGIYSFSHLTFQEYFSAKAISDNDKLLKQTISSSLFDIRWREVFLMIPSLMDDSTIFFSEVRKAIFQFSCQENGVKKILEAIMPIAGNTNEAYIKRILAIFYISNKNKIKPLKELSLPMAVDLVIARNPNLEIKHDFDLDFAFSIAKKASVEVENQDDFDTKLNRKISQQINIKKIDSDKKLVKLLNDYHSTFSTYLKGTKLLIELLDVECFLKKEIRRALLYSLFTESKEQMKILKKIVNEEFD